MKKIDWTSYKTILIAALIIRVIAAIFSQGYGMHDDHFLIVEAASSWVDGYDYNHWLPWSPDSNGVPEGHSFTYVGINFCYFWIMDWFGITDPKVLMLVNRLLHGIFSVLIVLYSIKITEKLSDKKHAVLVGWFLALLWMLPFLSVRNLVEIACIPFILASVWFTLKDKHWRSFIIAGLLMGMAVSFRYQVGVFAVGAAGMILVRKEWTNFFMYSLGVVITFSLTQGLVDYLIWGYPFAEFLGYFLYNANEGTAYIPNNNYFMYLIVLMGSFVVPLGLLLGAGFFRSAWRYRDLFVPVLLFVLFHSLYPSKQERFIFPVLPFFLILGVIGFHLYQLNDFWTKFWRVSVRIFWIINIPVLLVVSVAYSKKSRVEAMYYFYEANEKPEKILLECSGDTPASMPPKFYSGSWYFGILEHTPADSLLTVYPNYKYDFVLFYGEDQLEERIAMYQEIFPKMELVKRCYPSFIDRVFRSLNPRNRNEYIEVWKTHEIPA